MDESDLNGFEPRIGGHERFDGLTGQEPALGGGRRFDPLVWSRLIDPRQTSKETVVAELSSGACETYARVLVQILPAGSVFSEKLADGLVLGGRFSPDQRAAAAHVLGLIGARAGGTLAQSIAGPLIACLVPAEHEVVRVESVRSLALLRDGRAVRPLIDYLESGSWRLRLAAIHALGAIGDAEALPVLMALQQHGESLNEAMAALEALGVLGGQVDEPVRRQIFEHLAHVFVRGDNLQRGAAARALGFLGERDALDLVIEAAIHGRGDFQCSAVQSLGIFGDPQAVAPLIGVLTSGAYHARQDAVNSLIQIGRAAIRPALAILRHPDPDVRRGAIEVLGKVGASEARSALVERLQDSSPDVRRGAVAALGMIGGDGAVEVLVGALEDPDASVRKEATMMLSSFNDERVIGPLCLALWDADMTVRWFAAYALGVLKDARSVRHLCQALGDRSENVSRTAVDSLVRIGDLAVPVLAENAPTSTPAIRRLILDAIERIGSPLARATLQDLAANDASVLNTARLSRPGQ
jgi:HEAT repeat protein